MKYKNIDSALHNFGQSFLSGTNYIHDDHVMFDVYQMSKKAPGGEVTLNFSNGEISHPKLATPRVEASLKSYQARLKEHLTSHSVDPECLSNIYLRVRATYLGQEAFMHATDDRGEEHKVFVNRP